MSFFTEETDRLDAEIISMKAEIDKLKKSCENWEALHSSSLYGDMGELKYKVIMEMLMSMKADKDLNCRVDIGTTFGIYNFISDYASNLRTNDDS